LFQDQIKLIDLPLDQAGHFPEMFAFENLVELMTNREDMRKKEIMEGKKREDASNHVEWKASKVVVS